MNTRAIFLGLLSAAGAVVVLRPAQSYQGFMVKSTATAQTPAFAAIGAIAARMGIRHRSPAAVISGLFGAGVSAWYIRSVTASHSEFELAFGSNWTQLIPPETERRMIQRRRTLRLPRVPEPRWTRDIPFWTIPRTGRKLLADIWEPAEGVKRSGLVIVYLYGGSWHFFDKDVLTRPLFRQLTAQGHVVMDVGHRSCPETDVIGMVHDVHRAVAWIKEHSASYGVDPDQVVVMGGSSGAHIALLAAYAPDEPRLRPDELQGVGTSVMAVVSWYGIPEMSSSFDRWLEQAASSQTPATWERKEPGKIANRFNSMIFGRPLTAAQSPPAPPIRQLIQNLFGVAPEQAAAMYDLASPIAHVSPSCPPTLMFQGAHDVVVPLDAARRLHRTLADAGVPVVYVEYIWTEHAFDLMYPPLGNPAAKSALYDLERFLACVAATRPRQAARSSSERSVTAVA